MDAGTREGGEDGSCEPPVDVAAEEQTWDEAMHQALNIARAEGKVPGRVEETVKGAHASTLDWRTLLRRYMTDAAKSDYSWSLPNRRFIDSGLYLPSIRSEGIETVAVIVDTSGSLPTATLAAFWAELREVAAEIRPERVILLQVDAAVQDAAEYAPDDLPEEIAVKGRGGTDFRPGFEWLDEQGIQPAVCLYFTDMECSSYPEARAALSGHLLQLERPAGELEPRALGRAYRHCSVKAAGCSRATKRHRRSSMTARIVSTLLTLTSTTRSRHIGPPQAGFRPPDRPRCKTEPCRARRSAILMRPKSATAHGLGRSPDRDAAVPGNQRLTCRSLNNDHETSLHQLRFRP